MYQVNTDTLIIAAEDLQDLLGTDFRERLSWWGDNVHFALGQLEASLRDGAQSAETSTEIAVGINPDFQSTPFSERRICETRDQLIDLADKVRQLRTEIRDAPHHRLYASVQLDRCVREICSAVKKMRHADNEFLMASLNYDLGAGG